MDKIVPSEVADSLCHDLIIDMHHLESLHLVHKLRLIADVRQRCKFNLCHLDVLIELDTAEVVSSVRLDVIVVGWRDSILPRLILEVFMRFREELTLLIVSEDGRWWSMVDLKARLWPRSRDSRRNENSVNNVITGDKGTSDMFIHQVTIWYSHT